MKKNIHLIRLIVTTAGFIGIGVLAYRFFTSQKITTPRETVKIQTIQKPTKPTKPSNPYANCGAQGKSCCTNKNTGKQFCHGINIPCNNGTCIW